MKENNAELADVRAVSLDEVPSEEELKFDRKNQKISDDNICRSNQSFKSGSYYRGVLNPKLV